VASCHFAWSNRFKARQSLRRTLLNTILSQLDNVLPSSCGKLNGLGARMLVCLWLQATGYDSAAVQSRAYSRKVASTRSIRLTRLGYSTVDPDELVDHFLKSPQMQLEERNATFDRGIVQQAHTKSMSTWSSRSSWQPATLGKSITRTWG
jgi:hypothetical protein